jgi:hypothetical protein
MDTQRRSVLKLLVAAGEGIADLFAGHPNHPVAAAPPQ